MGYSHGIPRSGPCLVDGCEKPRFSRGYCTTHWGRLQRHGDPLGGAESGSPEHRAKISAARTRFMTSQEASNLRKRMSARMSGANHPQWKGDDVTYAAAHYRVRPARGAPQRCDECGTTEGRLEWANLTRDYPNPDDYIPLCKPCHNRRDGIVNNLRKKAA